MAGSLGDVPLYKEEGASLSVDVPYIQYAIGFFLFMYCLETYIDFRQHQKMHAKEIPKALAAQLQEMDDEHNSKTRLARKDTTEAESPKEGDDQSKKPKVAKIVPGKALDAVQSTHVNARVYNLEKSNFGFITGAFNMAENTLSLVLGFSPFLWVWAQQLAQEHLGMGTLGGSIQNEICVSLIFMLLGEVYNDVVHIPFELYSTFVIEERHGFNKQTAGIFVMDKIKGYALQVCLMYPIMALVIYIVEWGGDYFFIYVGVFTFVLTLFMMTIYPVVIAPLFNTFTPMEDGPLRQGIEALAGRLEFPLTKLFVVDGSTRSAHSNAYFYGIGKNKRIVLYDTLLTQVETEECVAILGHELGHWKMWHTIQGFVVSQLYMFTMFVVFSQCMNNDVLYSSFGFSPVHKTFIIGFSLFQNTLWSPIGKAIGFLMNINSRRNEFQADKFAVDLGYSKALQSGLLKIHLENMGNLNPDQWFSTYNYSHPPLVERLAAMKSGAKKVA